jgi:hypothetical protein
MIKTGLEDPRHILALTCGDPSGIGPEIALRAWLTTHADPEAASFFMVADPAHLSALAARLGWHVPIVETDPVSAQRLFHEALPVVPVGSRRSSDVSPSCIRAWPPRSSPTRFRKKFYIVRALLIPATPNSWLSLPFGIST